MANAELSNQFEIGVVGLDSSGRRLACTIAEQRLRVVAYDRNAENIKALQFTELPVKSFLKKVIHAILCRRALYPRVESAILRK